MTQDHNGPHVGSINYAPDYKSAMPEYGDDLLMPRAPKIRRVEAPRFKFKPQPDITPYELALVVEELNLFCDQATLDKLSERTWTDFKRHFEPTKPKR
jgi:hypothetical protein